LRNTALHPKQQSAEHDFIIVGSGAGGGPLAANLAKNGFRVLVLEAGGWDSPEVAQVPAFHPHASEHPDLSWEFFVKHYTNPKEPDSKWDGERNGIFYPRAATVGGCTVHNAMITMCGPSVDWDEIAKITNDHSWSGERMRTYFERLEKPGAITLLVRVPSARTTTQWLCWTAAFGCAECETCALWMRAFFLASTGLS